MEHYPGARLCTRSRAFVCGIQIKYLCRVVKADSDDHELWWSRADHGRCDLVFGSRLRRILLWGIALHTDTDCWFSRVNEAEEFGNCNR
jgi:hypothetical protein